MNIRDIKISKQLIFVFAISLFFVMVMGWVAYNQSLKLHEKTVSMYCHPFAVERALSMLKSDIVSLHRDMKDLSLVTNETEMGVELDWIKWWKEEGYKHILIVGRQYLGPRCDVDSLRQGFDSLCYVCDETIELMRSGKKTEVLNSTKTFGIVGYKVEEVLAKLQVVNDFAIKKGDDYFKESQQLNKSLNIQLIILVVLVLLFSIVIYLILLRNIRKPIFELTYATKKFQQGDLDAHSSYESKNEFGVLSASFNTMIDYINAQNKENIKRAEELGFVKGKAEQSELINEELRKVNSELNQALKKAEESERLKSAFLANMSHEIRTPMSGILGFTDLLKSPNLTGEEQQAYIRIIKNSGNRMLNIINDIINISKIESGINEVNITSTNINEQMEALCAFFMPETERKGLKLIVKKTLFEKEAVIKTDKDKIFAILTNLVKNAIKFTEEGIIEIGYEKKDTCLEFLVKDTGVGIPLEQREMIFERFRQGSESLSRNYEGAGLGLSISKAYVEMLGGKIWVESELEKGSGFYFKIPYLIDNDVVAKDKDIQNEMNIQPQIKCLKVLIAEDDETTEALIKIHISEYCKTVLIANTGVEAVKLCKNNPDIDLILMDIKMPEMSGYEATRQIRQFNKEVIIFAQTAYALKGDREKALDAGCNDYLAKPFNLDLFSELMRKYFSK
ncbi:MAG: hypothetical protein CVU05_15660 [Bacteroidetes bacterium HGW-Bacteroidetes-21]|jgi:signal transduction histidine kinase|nr:MAG: hypothetical protein CVU05_15660 [Bacteroidetes bacterium HGW-Bacteroidetes-21]